MAIVGSLFPLGSRVLSCTRAIKPGMNLRMNVNRSSVLLGGIRRVTLCGQNVSSIVCRDVVYPRYSHSAAIETRHLGSENTPVAGWIQQSFSSRTIESSRHDSRLRASERIISPETEVAPHFGQLPLDRAGHLRSRKGILDAFLSDTETKIIYFWGGKALVNPYKGPGDKSFSGQDQYLTPEGECVKYVPFISSPLDSTLSEHISKDPGYIFLGLEKDSGVAVFAAVLNSIPEDLLSTMAIDVRKDGPGMASEDAAVMALANGLIKWHSGTQFCAQTGEQASDIVLGGHGRRVGSKKGDVGGRRRSIYPRIDPAVIVGAMHGDWILLGRKQSWRAGRYSLLAGFVEVGETLESACLREVEEESGVKLDIRTVTYHSSQPWPFPQSLMAGFIAQTPNQQLSGVDLLTREGAGAARTVGLTENEIERYKYSLTLPRVDFSNDELEDARWFHMAWVEAQLERPVETLADDALLHGNFRIPGKHALANKIIKDCLVKLASRMANMDPSVLRHIPEVSIPWKQDEEFKYILLRAAKTDGDAVWHSKILVRGDPRASYHNHIFTATKSELMKDERNEGIELEVLGGGRIKVEASDRSIHVYGYSAAFGQAPHDITGAILRANLPFHSVNVSYDGY
eukprot:jgi/Picsp_1/1746/NSC_05218-R1_nad+ diphosphatase